MAGIRLASVLRLALFFYLALVVVTAALAGLRLSESAEMPGLQAIELVLLALPWSLALGIKPFSHFDFSGMVAIVALGVVLNALLFRWLHRFFERREGDIG
jgi:hypothetical protein